MKSRIQYILDVLGKMETALQQPILVEEKSRTRSPSPKETRRVKRASSEDESEDDSR